MIIKSTPARREKIHSILCDCCKVEYSDTFEIQEFLRFSDTAGYGNHVVGDMTEWSIDLCQKCWYTLLGQFIQRK